MEKMKDTQNKVDTRESENHLNEVAVDDNPKYPEDIENATEVLKLPKLKDFLVDESKNNSSMTEELSETDLEKKEAVQNLVRTLDLVRLKESPFSSKRFSYISLSEPLKEKHFEDKIAFSDRVKEYDNNLNNLMWLAPSLDENDNLVFDYRSNEFLIPIELKNREPQIIRIKIVRKNKPKIQNRRRRRSELIFSQRKEPKEETKVIENIEEAPEKKEKKKTKIPFSSILNRRKKATKRQLKKQQNYESEVASSKAQEISNNLKTPASSSDNLIFTNVPDNILNGGITLFNNLTRQMQKNGSLRVEHLMTVLGSLAGYSTQAAAREKMINRLGLSEEQIFSVIETADGSRYYFGDAIDRSLQKDNHSIWYMTSTAVLKLSGKVDVNLNEIVRYNIRNLGKNAFGIPRVNKNLRDNSLPEYYVSTMWNSLLPGLERFTKDPIEWPQIFGVALQRALILTKDILSPNISQRIILESAVPMSIADVELRETNSLSNSIGTNKQTIDQLRSEIDLIKKTLNTSKLPQQQRASLLVELSDKMDQLYKLLS